MIYKMDTFDYSTTESAYDYSTMEYTGTADYWSTMDADESLYTTVAPLEDVFDFRTWLFNSLMQNTENTSSSFIKGFIASLSVVVVSELGDKTFFIAAIMAMKHPRFIVFLGAISALVFMTVLSAAFGSIATVIPRIYTYYISAALFAIFGIKMLRDGFKMDKNEGQEELEEVQSELKRREDQVCGVCLVWGTLPTFLCHCRNANIKLLCGTVF